MCLVLVYAADLSPRLLESDLNNRQGLAHWGIKAIPREDGRGVGTRA